MKIVVFVNGGVVSSVLCDVPGDVHVLIADSDVEGCDEEDLVQDRDGDYVYKSTPYRPGLAPEYVEHLYKAVES